MNEAEFWRTVACWIEAGEPCALCMVVRIDGSAPRHLGAKMIVKEDGTAAGTVGGGALELEVSRAARRVLAEGEPRLLSFDLQHHLGMLCGGKAEVFVEPLHPPERLYLFGAGHIGQALAPMAAHAGFAVTVIDERVELANKELFPEAVAFVHGFDVARWESLSFDERRTYCVVVSPNHAIDFALARELLARPARYVGVIGSRRKRQAADASLREAGISAERIASLHSPIGEPIGAETPVEIAVSILAELVRVRRAPASASQLKEHKDG